MSGARSLPRTLFLGGALALVVAAVVMTTLLWAGGSPASAQDDRPAAAQTSVTLVGNTGKATSGKAASGIGSPEFDHAQAFITGSDSGGYQLTRVQVDFATATATKPGYTMEIWSDSSGSPGSKLHTLTNPASLSSGINNFDASGAGIDLDASTAYRVVAKDTTVPTLESAVVNGTALRLNYNEALDTTSVPAVGSFAVSVAGTNQTPTAISVSGKTVTLTLGTAATAGQTVTVTYTVPTTNPIQDLAGNDAAALSSRSVTYLDSTAPTVVGGTVDLIGEVRRGTKGRLKLYFSEELDPSYMPLKSDFTLFEALIGIGGLEDPHGFSYSQSETISWFDFVQVDGNTLELNVGKGDGGIASNAVYWIRIDDTSRIRDLSGNTAAASAERVEIVNLYGAGFHAKLPGAPRLAANAPLVVDGETLTVRFDQTLIPFTTVTGTGGFSVSGAAQPTAVTHVDTTATTVALTLDREVGGSETGIELSYDAGTTAIRNFFEQRAAGFENRAVANAGAADTAKPALVAGASTIAGADVRLRFSEEMSASNPQPTGSQFVLSAGAGGTDLGSVTLVSISESVVRLSTQNAASSTDGVSLTITDTSNIRDLAGSVMDAVSGFSLTNTGGTAPGKPGLASDGTAAVLRGNVLTLTFDQALDRANVPPASAFAVSGAFPKVIVDAVAIDGAHVRLTLHQAIAGGTKGLAVSYDESAGKRLRNLWREAADGFEGQPVRAAGTDTVAPEVVRGEVRGDELKLYFDEPMDATSEPAGAVLGLWAVHFERRWILGTGRADVAGNVVTVTLKEAVKQGEWLEVWYRAGEAGDNPLQDAAGNRLGADCHAAMACFNAWVVDNIDTHPPKMMAGTVKGSAVTLHFSEPLDRSVTPAASQFTFVGPSVGAGAAVAIDGVRITMTTEKELAAAGETINVIIADTANIRDRAGNQAEAVANAFALTNLRDADPGAPVLVTRDDTAAVYPAKVSGDTLALTFDKTLDTSSAPAWSGPEDAPFRLGPAAWLPAVASVSGIEGGTVILRLDNPVQPCDGEYLNGAIAVDYVKPAGGPLQNLWGTDVAAFSGQAVENLGADRCTTVSAEMSVQGESGRSVTVGFDRALDTRDAPETAAFTVASAAASGEAIAVEGAAFSEAATDVVLRLSRAVAAGEALTVSYRRPEGGKGLWDTQGNEIAPFSVTNAVSETPALSVSDARAVEGEAVEFTVSLSAASDEQVTVDYATSDGTAESGTDFTAASGTLTFAAGATTQTVRVETADDSADEADETFALTLSNPAGATLGDAEATGAIEDDDEALAALKAEFHGMPAEHNGRRLFSFEIRFSEEFEGLRLTALGAGALEVTGGRLVDVKRTTRGENRSVTVRVRPASSADVTVSLAATTDCSAGPAICTRDGRMLSNSPSATVSGPPNTAATGAPAIAGEARVVETLTASTDGIADADGLSGATFAWQWVSSDGAADADIAGATGASYTLADSDEGKAVKVRVTFTDDGGHQETLTSAPTATVAAAPPENSPAAGAPMIRGTARVGETLTARTTRISDGDGLTNATFSYQWLADDADISGATGSTYTLAAADEGKAIRVRVSFTDDAGNDESLTSAATSAVAAALPPPAPTNLVATDNGNGTLTLTWDAPDDDSVAGYQILRRRPNEGEKTLLIYVADTGSTDTTWADEDVTIGTRHVYRVKAINAAGLSQMSNLARATPASPPENNAATGAATITGTAQVGETLTADTSGISDADGLDNAVFSYQWLADDVDISGATSSTYTLATADEGKAIKLKVSFTDDAGNDETLTSEATAAVTPQP